VYVHIPLSSAQFFNINADAKHCKCDNNFIPDLLNNEETSTGLYIICFVVMQQTSIVQMTAFY